ncbi:MAG: hypothetical protein OXC61_03810 [Flavobacteriaceae bacterium]|nr:hypothetical protein [Flavobacteriaceae bacterium]
MITEKQKQFVIEQMKPFDPIEIRVFENTPTSVGFFYHFKKPCGLDFVDIWDAIEDKFQKQARFVRIPDIAITHPYDQE